MIKNIDLFIKLKKQQTMYNNFLENQKREKKAKIKTKHLIENQNKSNIQYNFNVSKVYQLENLHKKINWYKYYLELYLYELIQKYENIKNNKINLK